MSRLRTLISLRGALLVLAAGLLLGAGAFAAPLLLRGPRLLSAAPADGASALNPRAPITLAFDQPVRAASVAAAVRLDPPAELDVAAAGGTVTLTPRGGLRYGASYTLTVSDALSNILGRGLAAPVRVAFTTLPYVAVAAVTPPDGAAGLASSAPVTVEFSDPVVSAEQVAAAADDPRLAAELPQPLLADPPAPGAGRWLSPTRFSFAPADGWSAATTYTLTLGPQLLADGSAQLEAPFRWSFRTGAAVLAGARPYDTQAEVPADSAVELRLARDVDAASAAERFTLTRADGAPVAGTAQVEGETILFRPAAPLERGARYEAAIAPGVRAASGAAINQEPLTWSFTVVGDLAVAQVIPPPDAGDILTTTRQIAVTFNHPVVAVTAPSGQAALPEPLSISPPLRGEGRWLDTSTFVFSPTAGLDPATTYEVSVAPGLRDQTGGELRQPFAWRFSTLAPLAYGSLPEPGARFASPVGPFTLVFNQELDLASLQGAVTLRAADGSAVPGSVARAAQPAQVLWRDAAPDANPYVSGFTVAFTPSAPLQRGGRYTLEVGTAARTPGGAPLQQPYSAAFTVAPLPALLAATPADGAAGVPTGEPIALTFSAPMDWGSLGRSLTIEPAPTSVYTSTNENELYLYLDLVPEAEYRLTIAADARDPYGATLGQEVGLGFTTAPLAPSLFLAGSGRLATYSSYAPARVPLQTINQPSVSFDVYRVERAELPGLLAATQDEDRWRSLELDPARVVKGEVVRPAGERNRATLTLLDAGALAPGAYMIEARGAGVVERQLMLVSPYALTLKRSEGRVFVWAVDLRSGDPAPGLALRAASFIYERGALGEATDIGATGADGVLEAELAAGVYDPLYLWSADGAPFAVATSLWSDGIDPWAFSVPASAERPKVVGSLSTDRPLYRPAELVHIKGVLRRDGDPRYTLPEPGSRAAVTIMDPNGSTVFSTTLALGEFGSFSADLPLPQGAALGGYTMLAGLDGAESPGVYGSFAVAEYRKPVFEVAVAPARPDVLPGEQIEATLSARYFAGGALADAPVRWRLLAAPFFFSSDAAPGYQFQDLDDAYASYRWGDGSQPGGAELIAEGEGRTDAQGRLSVRLPAELGKDRGSRTLTLDMEVTDLDGQVIASQGALRLHAGAFYIGVRPDGYVAEAGSPQRVALITLDPQGQPVGGRRLEVGVFTREWYSVREQGPDGRFYFTSAYTDTLLQRLPPVTTDAQGRAETSFTPPAGGSYRIAVTGRDDGGREVRAAAYTWAYGGDVFWGVNDSNRIDLVADRTSYRPGDTARILVPAPYRGSTALLTIERGAVIEHRTLRIAGTSELIEVPVSADYAPNVYVSVLLITPAGQSDGAPAAPDLRMGLINLPVSSEQQRLTVTVSADKAQVGPRDAVTYTVRTADHTGRGVPAEVSLALVDEALLSLADDPNPSLEAAFYERRPLGVLTAQSLTALADRVTLALQDGAKGGGGGLGPQGAPRRDFPDTAYWNPALVTGADGVGSVTVELPDSLTTWRMTARAVTRETLVGQGAAEVVATRPLLVRPALPRFLSVGDRPELGAVVQNQTGGAVEATVTLEILPAEGGEAAVRLDGAGARAVSVPANGQAILRWPAEAVGAGPATVRLRVVGGGMEDALELPLNVQRYATPETAASAGQVIDQVVETLRPPAGADGEVALELTPSLTAGLRGGLRYLESFPYACTEQTVSAFLPNAVTYRLLKQLGQDDAALRASLERSLSAGLQRLYALQAADGGWGWWEGDESQPYLTAYVVQGLGEAVKAGYGVDQAVLARALDYLRGALDRGLPRSPTAATATALNERAYVLFVLGELGQPDRGRGVALFERRGELDLYGRAYLLMALDALGDEQRVAALAADLEAAAIMRPADAHWEEGRDDYATMGSDTRTTALALQALVRAEPDSVLIPNAVRYLMGLRDGAHWRTTQESAASLIALAEYAAASGDLEADYSYRAALGDRTLHEGSARAASAPVTVTVPLADLAAGADVPLTIQRQAAAGQSGKGRLYYTLRMRVYQDAAAVQPLDQGVGVRREYIRVDPTTLGPTGEPAAQVPLGGLVQVRLTLTVPEDMPYFTVEDMLPAGLEAVDTSLKTTSAAAADPALAEGGDAMPGWWYFGRTEVRDNRVALFATSLPRGTYVYSYLARATTPGTFQTLPATAMRTYAPEVFGRSAGALLTVTAP